MRGNNLQSGITETTFQRAASNAASNAASRLGYHAQAESRGHCMSPVLAIDSCAMESRALNLLSSRDAQREWPLVMLGPGGDFTRRYIGNGEHITRERAVTGAQMVSTDGATDRTAASDIPMFRDGFGLLNALRQVRERFAAIAHEIFTTTTIVDDDEAESKVTADGSDVSDEENQSQSEARRTRLEGNHDESHSEATPRPAHDSRFSSNAGLLANDAGDRRSARRQQGYGVRARRSAHREGSADSGQEQGTLFVDCA
ncbi:MAG: hypothetical protein RIR10_1464 [Planctomycetota bacterium]